jgi:hypothetical protein
MKKINLIIKFILITIFFAFLVFADFLSLKKKFNVLLKSVANYIINLKNRKKGS